jgi:hypothetical protein
MNRRRFLQAGLVGAGGLVAKAASSQFPYPIGMLTGAAETYSANAVRFDGSADYLLRGAGLSGASDSKVGVLSFWFQFQGGDGSEQMILHGAATTLQIHKQPTNKLRILFQTGGFNTAANLTTTSTYTADDTWHHLLASWNCATPVAYLYVDDADDLWTAGPNHAIADEEPDWTHTDFAVGSTTGAGDKLDCEIADLYVNIATSLDLSSAANRRKFIDAEDLPVDLLDDGSGPTGSAPIIYLSGATATWHTNKGGGGGFTESGALTDGADSPSD